MKMKFSTAYLLNGRDVSYGVFKGIYNLLGLQNNSLLFNGILLQCVHERFAENSFFGINVLLIFT